MPRLDAYAASAKQTFEAGDMAGLRTSLLLHAVGGLVILLLALAAWEAAAPVEIITRKEHRGPVGVALVRRSAFRAPA